MTGLSTRLKTLRAKASMTPVEVEQALSIGPGWIEWYELRDANIPSVDVLLTLCKLYGADPAALFAGLTTQSAASALARAVYTTASGDGVDLHFAYGEHAAIYHLSGATTADFDEVVGVLRSGLAAQLGVRDEEQQRAIKTQAVADAFWLAVRLWPHANPSDIWGFVIGRAYCDRLNHPAQYAWLDLGQSWKRTLGWALEKVLVRHYGDFLQARGVIITIPPKPRKLEYIEHMTSARRVGSRLEADKVDVFLVGVIDGVEVPFGVVHVKNSFAERRTDDVDMSRALVTAGFASPLWTMDCKSWPSATPKHTGELGKPLPAKRSAKRVDIEEDGYFSACFSYNQNTIPTPLAGTEKARVITCDFTNPDDAFAKFVLAFWGSLTR